MPAEYGRTQLSKLGRDVEVIADGDYSGAKAGGITLAAPLIPTNTTGSALTLKDDTVVAAGAAYMRFGQVLCKCTSGTYAGLWGPYDTAATDGRQTLTRGQCAILNRTWVDAPTLLGTGMGTNHPAVFEKGLMRKDRLITSGTGTHSLAAGPTDAELEAALPGIRYVTR